MIELISATKSYGPQTVVDRVDLRIAPGKTTVLLGPSGCGKSTLLRMMLGLVLPESGSVVFDGAALAPASLPALRRRTGYVIQDGGLFPHMTAAANVTLMAREQAWIAQRIDARLDALVKMTHFPRDGLSRYPLELSGGQRQRVALMRALMLDPDVLLLDEPLGALDPMIRYELQGELRQIFSELSKTVVLVTHDLVEAGHFADTIVLLRDGRIVQQGSLDELVSKPADAFVTRFVRAQRGEHV